MSSVPKISYFIERQNSLIYLSTIYVWHFPSTSPHCKIKRFDIMTRVKKSLHFNRSTYNNGKSNSFKHPLSVCHEFYDPGGVECRNARSLIFYSTSTLRLESLLLLYIHMIGGDGSGRRGKNFSTCGDADAISNKARAQLSPCSTKRFVYGFVSQFVWHGLAVHRCSQNEHDPYARW